VIKIVTKNELGGDQTAKEASITSDHPNVLKCFGSTENENGDRLVLVDQAVKDVEGNVDSVFEKLRKSNDGELTFAALSKNKRIEFIW